MWILWLKMEESVPSGSVCCFCLTTYEDEALYGKFYKIDEITTHYFCMLLSSKIQQRGSDNEGILGFLPQDIRNEVQRGKGLTCTYCGKRGATLSCFHSKCRLHFHLPCGRARETFHEFFGEFKSFCCRHRKMQRIKQEVLKAMSGKQSTCSICLESVPATPSPSTLWAPCCSKDAWFHRICIQRLALSAGYFFKCPLCNNTAQFVESMRTYGIWIPEQDASWERDPERYEGLLQRHNSCDAKSCRCRNGRTHHVEDTKWEIKLCADCGSQGMHVQCGNLRLSQDWICSVCSNVAQTDEHKKTGKISRSREAVLARNRERRRLPVRPQRVTRQRRPLDDEDGEEEGGKIPHSVHSKSEIPAPKTDKGASSTPQKDVSSLLVHGQASTAQSREARPEGRPSSPQDENSDVEILENSDDEIQHGPATKNEPLLCDCKWSNLSRNIHHSDGADICCYCYDWTQQYIHIGKSSSATTIKNPQNLLSRFLSTLTAMPGPALGKGEPLCQLWVIHYHSRKSNCASTSRSSNRASSTSVSKTPPTLSQSPRTRSQSRSSGYQKLVSNYSKSEISSPDGPSTLEVDFNRQSSEYDSRLHSNEVKTRRRSNRNKKNSQGKRKRSVSPGTSNNKRSGNSLRTNNPSQVKPSKSSPRRKGACSQLAKSSCVSESNSLRTNNPFHVKPSENSSQRKRACSNLAKSSSVSKSNLATKNAKDGRFSPNSKDPKVEDIWAMAKLASFQPVVVLTRYNIRRRERSVSVERDSRRRLCQRGGRSRRDQFTLRKQLEATDDAHKFWKEASVSRQTRKGNASPDRKLKRSVCRNFKNFRERSPIRTRSRSRSVEGVLKIQKSSQNQANVSGSNRTKIGITVKENFILRKNISQVATFSGGGRSPIALSSSDETDDEAEVEEDDLNETLASIRGLGTIENARSSTFENARSSDESDDEIEDEVHIGEESLNDTLASISELGTITYDEDCSSLFSTLQPNASCSRSFSDERFSSSEENSSSISISTSSKDSSSCSSPTLTFQSPNSSSQSSSTSQPSPTLQLSQIPSSKPHPILSPVPLISVSVPAPTSVLTSSAGDSQNLSGTVVKPFGCKNQLSCYSKHISHISSPLVKSPLSSTPHAESTNSRSPVTYVPLRRSSRRSCSPRESVLPSTSRVTRKIHSNVSCDMSIRGLSPPPIFPNRSGSLTEWECRIKARALTARKFVPMSPAATQQRARMRYLQGRR